MVHASILEVNAATLSVDIFLVTCELRRPPLVSSGFGRRIRYTLRPSKLAKLAELAELARLGIPPLNFSLKRMADTQKRIAALDIGDKRIGVAVSDGLGLTAQPLSVIHRASVQKDIAAIMSVIAEYEVDYIVAGLPLQMDGHEGEQAGRVRKFCEAFHAETGLQLIFQDERLTTVAGERLLVEAGVSRNRRRQVIDKTAASLILQTYLESVQRES